METVCDQPVVDVFPASSSVFPERPVIDTRHIQLPSQITQDPHVRPQVDMGGQTLEVDSRRRMQEHERSFGPNAFHNVLQISAKLRSTDVTGGGVVDSNHH
jgi:hypothetical protein